MNHDLARAVQICRRMKRHPLLKGWRIVLQAAPVRRRAAIIDPQNRAKHAVISLDPDWRNRTDLTLRGLILHELGHIPAGEHVAKWGKMVYTTDEEEDVATLLGQEMWRWIKLKERTSGSCG